MLTALRQLRTGKGDKEKHENNKSDHSQYRERFNRGSLLHLLNTCCKPMFEIRKTYDRNDGLPA
jgi:hypothetical protein